MSRNAVAGLSVAVILFAGAAAAQPCGDVSASTHFVNRAQSPSAGLQDAGENLLALRVDWPWLYAVGGPIWEDAGWFQVYDVSDPRTPRFAAELSNLWGFGSQLEVDGGRAYVVGVDDGFASVFSVIDISDPASPEMLARIDWPYGLEAAMPWAAPDRETVVVPASDSLLVTVDSPRTGTPSVRGVLSVPGAHELLALAGDGDWLYLLATTDAGPRFLVYDAHDPRALQLRGDLPLQGSAMTVDGNHVFVSGSASLDVVDVQDPDVPLLIGTVPTRPLSSIVRDGDRLLASGTRPPWFGVDVFSFDISDPTAPVPLGFTGIRPRSGPASIVAARGYLFAIGGDYQSDLGIVSARIGDDHMASPGPLATVEEFGSWIDRCLIGTEALTLKEDPLQSGSFFLERVDLSDPLAPAFVGSVDLGAGEWRSVDANGDVAIVAGASSILSIDLVSPGAPFVADEFMTGGLSPYSGLDGNLFVIHDYARLRGFDVSDPGAIVEVGSAPLPVGGTARGVVLGAGRACVSVYTDFGPKGVLVFDFSDPVSPVQTATIDLYGSDHGLLLYAGVLWVTSGADHEWLSGFDVGDPSSPVQICRAGLPRESVELAGLGDHLYVGTNRSGVLVLEVADPASPFPIANLGPEASPVGLGVVGPYVISGNDVYDAQCEVSVAAPPAMPSRLAVSASPNPFNPAVTLKFELELSQRVAVKIYDTAGRLVRTLADGLRSGGPQRLQWDGSDDSGRSLASGVYFVKVETGTEAGTTRVTLLK